MNYKLALCAAVSLLVGGCAQQQANQGGASDFEPLPIRDTVLNDGTLPRTTSSSPGPELIRQRKRYEAVPI